MSKHIILAIASVLKSPLATHGQGHRCLIKNDCKKTPKISRTLWASLISHLDSNPLVLLWFPKTPFCWPKAGVSAEPLDRWLSCPETWVLFFVSALVHSLFHLWFHILQPMDKSYPTLPISSNTTIQLPEEGPGGEAHSYYSRNANIKPQMPLSI